jgi:hypothetical protein
MGEMISVSKSEFPTGGFYNTAIMRLTVAKSKPNNPLLLKSNGAAAGVEF